MQLSLESLRNSPESVERYKDRQVKIYNNKRGYWFGGVIFGCQHIPSQKSCATIMSLADAMQVCSFFKSGIEFWFEDTLGEEHFKLTDYDEESIHNNPDIKFEDLKTKLKL